MITVNMTSTAIRTKICYERKIAMNNIFDHVTARMVTNLSGANCVPECYIMPLLITASAHHLNGSLIKPVETWEEPSIIYAAVAGGPGSNKSRAASMFRKAIVKVERVKGIGAHESRINQGKV